MIAYKAFTMNVINMILVHTSYLLELFSYDTEIIAGDRLVRIVDTVGVSVGEPCIGYGVITFFIALIVSFPGPWSKKIWFIPLGVLVIYLANLSRISLLAVSVQYDGSLWELNHKFLFKIVVYGIVFLLWSRWVKMVKQEMSNNTKKRLVATV